MAYAQFGKIEATDYNNFINGSNQLNTVWGTGSGNAGYGQTPISTVTATGLVTATQWTSLLNTLNSVLVHQSGSGYTPSSVTAGARIDYLSTLQTNINTAYTNRLNYASSGSTTTGSTKAASVVANNDVTYNAYALEKTVTFASGDAARYFFNAGGRLQWKRGTSVNNDGTDRTDDVCAMFNALTATYTMGATDYYASTTSYVNRLASNDIGAIYTGGYVLVDTKSNGLQGANADAGSVITFGLYVYAAHTSGFNDTINATLNWSIDIIYPESTNLTSSWGTPTVQA